MKLKTQKKLTAIISILSFVYFFLIFLIQLIKNQCFTINNDVALQIILIIGIIIGLLFFINFVFYIARFYTVEKKEKKFFLYLILLNMITLLLIIVAMTYSDCQLIREIKAYIDIKG